MGNTETVDVFEEDKIGKASWSKFTPNANLSYSVSDDVLVYTGYSSGFKSGGFNVRGAALVATEFEPETVDTFSIGFKSKSSDGTFLFNGEIFHNQYSDKQFATIALDDSGSLVQTTDNVGEVTSSGFEIESKLVFPDIEGLSLSVNVGYLDSKIDEFIEQQEVPAESGTYVGVNIADKYELGFAPKWTAQGFVEYEHALEQGGYITWVASAAYRDESWTSSPIDITNDFAKTQLAESHTMYASSVTYRSADQNWRLRLEGKNLTDERILVHSFNVTDFNLGGYTRGRT